jgi:hypothetical protein
VDELISSPVDLSGVSAAEDVTLSFRYAYRKRNPSDLEYLKVFLSSNCGDVWVQRKTIFGDQLSSQTSGTSWTPAGPQDWVTVHMTNVTSSYFVKDFRFKFRFENDGGNNLFLDDINIYLGAPSDALVGQNELAELIDWTVYPNPADKEVSIRFDAFLPGERVIELRDIQGRLIEEIGVQASEGTNLVLLSVDRFARGTYFLNFRGDSNSKKIVIE